MDAAVAERLARIESLLEELVADEPEPSGYGAGSITLERGRHRVRVPDGRGKHVTIGFYATREEAEQMQAAALLARTDLDRDPLSMKPLRAPKSAGVYAVAGASGWVKIGRAKNIAERIKDLQVGHPVKLRLLAVLSKDMRDESSIHRRWHRLRSVGEWFRADAELVAFIRSCREQKP